MEKLKLNKGIVGVLDSLFLYSFLFYAILGNNSFTYGSKLISYVMWFALLLGVGLIFYRILNFKEYFKFPDIIFPVLMLASIGITTLVNYNSHFKENLIFCVYWAFYLLILFTVSREKSKEEIKQDFERFALVYMAYYLISAVLSFYLLLTGYAEKFVTADTGYEYIAGFMWGRLWGTHINPNQGAIGSAIACGVLVYFFITRKKIWKRILCALGVFCLVMYIALSDSRSGAVCLGVVAAVSTFVYMCGKKTDKKILFKGLAAVLAVIMLVVGISAPRKLKDGYNSISKAIVTEQKNDPTPGEPPKITPPTVDRGYDLSDDISNRRFDVWGSGVDIYLSSPKAMTVGVGFAGMLDYAKGNLPETYIVTNDYAELRTLDNEFFNIMAAQGSLGLLTAAAFVVFILIKLFKRIFKLPKDEVSFAAGTLAVVLGLACSAMFMGVMFYHFSPNSVMFWTALGSLTAFLSRSCSEEKANEQD